MNFTISAIQQLKLQFSVDCIGTQSALLLLKATRVLRSAVFSQLLEYGDLLQSLGHQSNAPLLQDSLCTWRPTYCIDMFLHIGHNSLITVGLPMLTDDEVAATPARPPSGLLWQRKIMQPPGATQMGPEGARQGPGGALKGPGGAEGRRDGWFVGEEDMHEEAAQSSPTPAPTLTPVQRGVGRHDTSASRVSSMDPALLNPDVGKVTGNDITQGNHELSVALQHQTTFTRSEWAAFGITDLRHGDYIQSGGMCFTPALPVSHVEIKHFTSESVNTTAGLPECVCFAHLTCDTDEQGQHTMVILVYDIIVDHKNTLGTRQRYDLLRSISEPLSGIVIGDACVRVQWAGDPSMCHRLMTLTLPHAHDKIVMYGDNHSYSQFAFGADAVDSCSDLEAL